MILFMGLLLFLFPNKALADDDENSGMGFSVVAVPSSKQIDPGESYFYLQTTPGEVIQLKVKVKSQKKEPVKVNVYGADAISSAEGTFEYTDDLKKLDKTLTDPISSMVKVETPTITVENFEEKEAVIQIVPPKKSYQGIKMGALNFELDDKSKAAVANKFQYQIGLITAENRDDYRDSQTLNLLEAKSTLVRGRKMSVGVLQNPEPKIISKLNIQAEVKEKETNKVLHKKKIEEYSLAPNSFSNFEIDIGRDTIKSGTYLLSIVASNDYGNWELEKEFKISSNEAKKMNEETAFKIITPMWIKVLTSFLFVMTGVLMIGLIIRRKKLENQWKVKKRKKRKKRKKKEGK